MFKHECSIVVCSFTRESKAFVKSQNWVLSLYCITDSPFLWWLLLASCSVQTTRATVSRRDVTPRHTQRRRRSSARDDNVELWFIHYLQFYLELMPRDRWIEGWEEREVAFYIFISHIKRCKDNDIYYVF